MPSVRNFAESKVTRRVIEGLPKKISYGVPCLLYLNEHYFTLPGFLFTKSAHDEYFFSLTGLPRCMK